MRNRKRRVPLNHKKRRAASHVRGTTHQSSLVWFGKKKETPHQNRDFPHRLAFICGVRGACLYALMPKTSQGQFPFLFYSCLFREFRRSLPFLRVRQQSAGRACVCVYTERKSRAQGETGVR